MKPVLAVLRTVFLWVASLLVLAGALFYLSLTLSANAHTGVAPIVRAVAPGAAALIFGVFINPFSRGLIRRIVKSAPLYWLSAVALPLVVGSVAFLSNSFLEPFMPVSEHAADHVYYGHGKRPVTMVAYIDHDRRIVSLDYASIQVWDSRTGRPVCTVRLDDDHHVFSPALDATSGIIAVEGKQEGSLAGQATIYRAADCSREASSDIRVDEGLNPQAFSKDGKYLVGRMRSDAYMFDRSAGKPVALAEGLSPERRVDPDVFSASDLAALSPNGELLILASDSDDDSAAWASGTDAKPTTKFHEILVYRVTGAGAASNAGVRKLPLAHPPLQGHTERIEALAVSPDGRQLASVSADRTLRLWDLSTGRTSAPPVEIEDPLVWDVAYAPDGRMVAVAGASGWSCESPGTIRFFDPATGRQIRAPLDTQTCGHLSLAFSSDGTKIVTGSNDGSVKQWRVATLKPSS